MTTMITTAAAAETVNWNLCQSELSYDKNLSNLYSSTSGLCVHGFAIVMH
jgi:hypothetical protein